MRMLKGQCFGFWFCMFLIELSLTAAKFNENLPECPWDIFQSVMRRIFRSLRLKLTNVIAYYLSIHFLSSFTLELMFQYDCIPVLNCK